MKIEKKCWTEYFERILSGDKTFELRLADWEVNIGDTLVSRDWDPVAKRYTGRKIEKVVSCLMRTKELSNCRMWPEEDIEKFGWQVIGFKS